MDKRGLKRNQTLSLDDLDAAAINGNYAATAGLAPSRDALFAEGGGVGEALHSVYSNIIAVRTVDQGKPWVAQLVGVYHSSAIRGFIIRPFRRHDLSGILIRSNPFPTATSNDR